MRAACKQHFLYLGRVNKRYSHSFNRKDLIPLIKFLHPDLLAGYSNRVKAQNMSCIQNLNDLWDTIEGNVGSGRTYTDSLDITIPFRAQYDLSCFLKAKTVEGEPDTAPVGALRKTHFVVVTPEELCKKQCLTKKKFMGNLRSIMQQQGQLFKHAGLDNPWITIAAGTTATDGGGVGKDLDEEEEKNRRRARGRGDVKGDSLAVSAEEMSELDLMIFERLVVKNAALEFTASTLSRMDRNNTKAESSSGSRSSKKNSRTGSYLNRLEQEESDYQHLFSSSVNRRSKFSQKPLRDRVTFGLNGAHVEYFKNDVETYLKVGNVMVQESNSMSKAEEFTAVQNIRQFLLDFADVLGFTLLKWHRVVILLHKPVEKKKYVSACEDIYFEEDGTTVNTSSNGGYSVQVVNSTGSGSGSDQASVSNAINNSHYILRIPHDFKPKDILDFVGKHLPAAKVSFV